MSRLNASLLWFLVLVILPVQGASPEKQKVVLAVGGKTTLYYLPLTLADSLGYFRDEGLDYTFREMVKSTDGAHHYKGDKVGAMQSFEAGRPSNVSCACHWTWRSTIFRAARGHCRH